MAGSFGTMGPSGAAGLGTSAWVIDVISGFYPAEGSATGVILGGFGYWRREDQSTAASTTETIDATRPISQPLEC
ncbi:MAG: hypothetical protein QOE61_2840 [Micromonosporaceae bacterium]|nr:hypothetical protein [Micromonosporaceae bacterium]